MSFAALARPGVATLPTYEPGRPIDEVARDLGFKDASEITKLASNENALGLSYVPSSANFVEVGQGRSCFDALQKCGVIVRPMDGYGLPDHIRITIGTADENDRCIHALKAVLGARV